MTYDLYTTADDPNYCCIHKMNIFDQSNVRVYCDFAFIIKTRLGSVWLNGDIIFLYIYGKGLNG